MADDVRQKVEDLIDKAKTYGRLVWLDATDEIVLIDTVDQEPGQLIQAQAITRELMEAEDLQEVLRAALAERRIRALASIGLAPPEWEPDSTGL